MDIYKFVNKNRAELSDAIKRKVPNMHPDYLNANGQVRDDAIIKLVMNDEGLYRWAVSEGVAI